jgi:hypothetical protein
MPYHRQLRHLLYSIADSTPDSSRKGSGTELFAGASDHTIQGVGLDRLYAETMGSNPT